MEPILDAEMPEQAIWPARVVCRGRVDPDILVKIGRVRPPPPWLSLSATTAVMTRRAFDIRRNWQRGHSYVLRHAIRMS